MAAMCNFLLNSPSKTSESSKLTEQQDRSLIDDLSRRFPMFKGIAGHFGEGLPQESIPWFFGLLMAAVLNRSPGSCCFVLDKTFGTTALTAIFVALVKLQEEFPSLSQEYARSAIGQGQLVRVKPSDYVYEYEGLWDGQVDKFRLRVQGKPERRTFPVSDVLRLEPTTRKRPKGTLVSELGVSEQSSLDDLLGIATFGNSSMIRNVVLLHMARARFEGVANTVSLGPNSSDRSHGLLDFFPWGTIGPDGEVRSWDQFQVVGEPIIAVSRVMQDVASAANQSPSGTKAILVDGARGVVGDLQSFDDIADRHRVVILASPNEAREFGILKERGTPVWHLSFSELMLGEEQPVGRFRRSLVGRTVRTADIGVKGNVITVDCVDDDLQMAADALEKVAGRLNQTEDRQETEDVVARLYGVLLEISESCLGVGSTLESRLTEIRGNFERNRMWMDPEDENDIRNILSLLADAADKQSDTTNKAERLREILKELDGNWAIVTRSSGTADSIRDGLGDLTDNLHVLPAQAVGPNDEWDGIILLAWPGRQRFTRLSSMAPTKETRVLVYPFERKWLSSHRFRESNELRANRMDRERRAAILGIEPSLLPEESLPESSRITGDETPEQPIMEFERRLSRRHATHASPISNADETRSARLIEFYGGCHVFLSEWSKVHVLNNLMDGGPETGKPIHSVSASQLAVDDFVLFRAGGGGDFVRLLATTEMGIGEYERVRGIAESWKQALHRLGRTPREVQMSLETHGLHRTLPTINGWLSDPDLIGPGYDDDLDIMARAAGDSGLLGSLNAVRDAISRIRGAHVAAGNQLTRLIFREIQGHLAQLDGQPVHFNFGFGQAWVVQVDAVSTDLQQYPADQLNHLIWTEDQGF